jgi:hypothetical protein
VRSARKGCEKEDGHRQMSVRFETKKQEGVIRAKNEECVRACVRASRVGKDLKENMHKQIDVLC